MSPNLLPFPHRRTECVCKPSVTTQSEAKDTPHSVAFSILGSLSLCKLCPLEPRSGGCGLWGQAPGEHVSQAPPGRQSTSTGVCRQHHLPLPLSEKFCPRGCFFVVSFMNLEYESMHRRIAGFRELSECSGSTRVFNQRRAEARTTV